MTLLLFLVLFSIILNRAFIVSQNVGFVKKYISKEAVTNAANITMNMMKETMYTIKVE